jgi:hypothetical protein
MSWKQYAPLLTYCNFYTVTLFFSLAVLYQSVPIVPGFLLWFAVPGGNFVLSDTMNQMCPKPKQYITRVHRFAVSWDMHLKRTVSGTIGTSHRVQ